MKSIERHKGVNVIGALKIVFHETELKMNKCYIVMR